MKRETFSSTSPVRDRAVATGRFYSLKRETFSSTTHHRANVRAMGGFYSLKRETFSSTIKSGQVLLGMSRFLFAEARDVQQHHDLLPVDSEGAVSIR